MEKVKTFILTGILLCLIVITGNYLINHKNTVVLEQTPLTNPYVLDSVVQLSGNRIGILTANKEISIFEYDEKYKILVMIGRYDYSDFYSYKLQKIK